MTANGDSRPLIAHLVYRFDVGGLENGVANLINHMRRDAYRHVVIALTEITDFRRRVLRDDVQFIALHKSPGHAVSLYPRLYRLFRDLAPAVLHTRNLAALEATVPAWAARVPVRIHGEHGRDVGDLDGSNRKYQWVRRLYRPFVTHYVALSQDLAKYLSVRVRVPADRISHIYNGVDTARFKPREAGRAAIEGSPFVQQGLWILGHVGRSEAVKDPITLAHAFVRALQLDPGLRSRLRLVIVGEGPLRPQARAILEAAGVAQLAWLPGERNDVPALLQSFDCFVLPSLAEGISNTILEAMACGLPVIATNVGGNAELLESGLTGQLVPAADAEAIAIQILAYAHDPAAARAAGLAGRARVERLFSLDAMVERYTALYDSQLAVAANGFQRIGTA
jgi:sugar transferase (PEP-CTERM/EpsH1 system associated)